MLQNLVGESQEVFSNDPLVQESSPFANIFGDTAQVSDSPEATQSASEDQETAQTEQASEEISQSAEDLFAELFSEEEIKKMGTVKTKEEEEDEEEETPEAKAKKKFDIEFY